MEKIQTSISQTILYTKYGQQISYIHCMDSPSIRYCYQDLDLHYVEYILHQIWSMGIKPSLYGPHFPSNMVNGYQTSTKRNPPSPFHQIWSRDNKHLLYGFHHPIYIINGVQTSTVWNTFHRVTVIRLKDSCFPVTTLHKSRSQEKDEYGLFPNTRLI